jgi:diguanylate cyclase (GGDEF)-like protein
MDPAGQGGLRAAVREARARLEDTLARQGWLQTLPSRLVLGVFSTVVVTSLAVAFTATRSTEGFLRNEIDQRFPTVLARTAERLDLWYDQRQLDVDTFSRSEIVRDHLRNLIGGARGRRGALAREELARYLGFILERFPQYRALFLLDREGEVLLWAGEESSLPDALMASLADVERPRVSDVQVADGVRHQVASASVAGRAHAPIGSLHAVLALDALDAVLRADDLSAEARILITRGDEVLAPIGASGVPGGGPAPLVVTEIELASGDRLIASRQDLERFGWSLWVTEPYDAAFAPVVGMIRRVWTVNLAIVFVLGAVAFTIARSMARPILELSRAARQIADGAEDVDIPVVDRGDEVGVLSRALRGMTARLAEDRAELRRANEILTQLSVTDGLTGLHNHRAFQDRLARDVRRAKRTGVPLSLVLFDVDDFKQLNDRHGHTTGDRVLGAVAGALEGGTRETDFVARYGGEEFALLAPVDADGARTLAENLRRAVGGTQIEMEGGAPLCVTVSAGFAQLASDADALFAAADRALYRAKHSGKDCVVGDGDDGPEADDR